MKVTLDFENINNKEELHSYLKEKLALPDYYGKNLDALYDCLTEWRSPAEIRMVHFESLQQRLGEYAKMLLKVLQESGQIMI